MIATWGFFVKLHPFYYFAMSYVFGFLFLDFWFFFHRKEKLFKIMFTCKSSIQKGKKKVGKKLNEKRKGKGTKIVTNMT
jgi:hypothetical protein